MKNNDVILRGTNELEDHATKEREQGIKMITLLNSIIDNFGLDFYQIKK